MPGVGRHVSNVPTTDSCGATICIIFASVKWHRNPAPLLCRQRRLASPVLRKLIDAKPAPIDAMMLDQTMLDFHYFHELDLIAVGRLPWILPNQNPFAVREPIVGSIPPHKFVWSAARPPRRTVGSPDAPAGRRCVLRRSPAPEASQEWHLAHRGKSDCRYLVTWRGYPIRGECVRNPRESRGPAQLNPRAGSFRL